MTIQRFRVHGTATASVWIAVEIETDGLDPEGIREAAIEAAGEEGMPDVCGQCGGWGRDSGIELDGEWVALDGDGVIEPLGGS